MRDIVRRAARDILEQARVADAEIESERDRGADLLLGAGKPDEDPRVVAERFADGGAGLHIERAEPPDAGSSTRVR